MAGLRGFRGGYLPARTPNSVALIGARRILHAGAIAKGPPELYESLMNLLKTKQYRNFGSLDPLVKANKNDLSEEALFLIKHFPSVIN